MPRHLGKALQPQNPRPEPACDLLCLRTIGAEALAPVSWHLLMLAVLTVVFLGLAVWAYFRDEGKTYG